MEENIVRKTMSKKIGKSKTPLQIETDDMIAYLTIWKLTLAKEKVGFKK